MLVVPRTIVGLTTPDGVLQFIREGRGPLVPGEMTLLGHLTASAKAWPCHGCANTGPSSSRRSGGRLAIVPGTGVVSRVIGAER